MKRHFTYCDEKSDKFWQIHLDGATVTVVFGKTGTAGRVDTKTFASADEAAKAAEKLVAEKLRKGYREEAPGEFSENDFWNLIERARKGSEDCEDAVERLQSALEKRPVEDILAYERIRRRLFASSYNTHLWSAAYYLNGGCSDDGFEYFRGWLLLRGRKTFYHALEDPDSLASSLSIEDLLDELECEPIMYAACRAYEAKTGRSMDDFYEQIGESPEFAYPELNQEDFEAIEADDETIRRTFPKLFAKRQKASGVAATDDVHAHFVWGSQAMSRQDYATAAFIYEHLIQNGYRTPIVYQNAILSNIELRNISRAAELLQAYTAEAGKWFSSQDWFYSGLVATLREQYEEAIDHYSRALEQSETPGLIYYNRGYARLQIGDYQAAMEDANASLTDAATIAHYSYALGGLANLHLGNATAAFTDIQTSFETMPDNNTS